MTVVKCGLQNSAFSILVSDGVLSYFSVLEAFLVLSQSNKGASLAPGCTCSVFLTWGFWKAFLSFESHSVEPSGLRPLWQDWGPKSKPSQHSPEGKALLPSVWTHIILPWGQGKDLRDQSNWQNKIMTPCHEDCHSSTPVKIALSVLWSQCALVICSVEQIRTLFLVLWLCFKPSFPFLLWRQGLPSTGFSVQVQLDPLHGKTPVTTESEAANHLRPHPSSEGYGQPFPRADTISMVVLRSYRRTRWHTGGRREEERDHLENR